MPPEYFALRKQMAFHAWYENMPVRRAQLPRGPAIAAYRTLRYGRLDQINVLDTRQYRDDQPCGDGLKAPCGDERRGDEAVEVHVEAVEQPAEPRGDAGFPLLRREVAKALHRFLRGGRRAGGRLAGRGGRVHSRICWMRAENGTHARAA